MTARPFLLDRARLNIGRNTAWLQKNPWFEAEIAPYLRQRVSLVLAA